MIDAIVALLAGGVAGWLAWRACRGIFAHDVFARTNYRGAPLATSAGLTGSIAAVGMVGGLVVADAAGLVELGTSAWSVHIGPTLLLALGFCLLGLIDDLAGVGESGGFSGHLRSLASGTLTTGGLKLFGGALLALVAAAMLNPASGASVESMVSLLRDGALIALAANLANLFDRAPGRVLKVTETAGIVAIGAIRRAELAPFAALCGCHVALLAPDLREEAMVGDAGSNVLGAAVGAAVVATTGGVGRWSVLAVVLALNLASEAVSFTRVIDSVGPLRALDRLGAPHRPR